MHWKVKELSKRKKSRSTNVIDDRDGNKLTGSRQVQSSEHLYDTGKWHALLIGHWTCDLQVPGLSPGMAPLHSVLGQATYTCVPLLPSSIIWYRPRGRSPWL